MPSGTPMTAATVSPARSTDSARVRAPADTEVTVTTAATAVTTRVTTITG